jgi:hypothetical protein
MVGRCGNWWAAHVFQGQPRGIMGRLMIQEERRNNYEEGLNKNDDEEKFNLAKRDIHKRVLFLAT